MKTLRYLLAIALVLSFASCRRETLTIIHFNDTHSHFEPERSGEYEYMGGVIERAAYIDSVRNADGEQNVLLLHAGDFSQGTSYFTLLGGDLEIQALNALSYDCVALGNHEFDNGLDDLARRLSMLECPVVCSNYDFSSFEVGKYIRPYVILEKAGMKIGIFSLLTDVTKVVDKSISANLKLMDNVSTAQKWADYLKKDEKCDLVVALTHIGYEGSSFTDPDLVRQTRNVDVVIGGHSHTFLEDMAYETNLDGKKIPIVQNGCWGLYSAKLSYRK